MGFILNRHPQWTTGESHAAAVALSDSMQGLSYVIGRFFPILNLRLGYDNFFCQPFDGLLHAIALADAVFGNSAWTWPIV